jgi:hypothetical protein
MGSSWPSILEDLLLALRGFLIRIRHCNSGRLRLQTTHDAISCPRY